MQINNSFSGAVGPTALIGPGIAPARYADATARPKAGKNNQILTNIF
jgi:hypothetical protein